MSRPLLNLSIVELMQLFEDSQGNVATSLNLLKELRHRSTPKANALTKRVMVEIAKGASTQQLQTLHVPELEILAKEVQSNSGLSARLIAVLDTRNSSKALKLLSSLKSDADVRAKSPHVGDSQNFSKPHSAQPIQLPSLLLAKTDAPVHVESTSSVLIENTSDVAAALALFGLSIGSTWREVEAARQLVVQRYRPIAFADRDVAKIELSRITNAYLLLSQHMGSIE